MSNKSTTDELEEGTLAPSEDDAYAEAIEGIEDIGKQQIKAIDDYTAAQKEIQDETLGVTLDKLDKSKNEAEADYNKEQGEAYADWKKQSDPYGVNAEKIAGAGMSGSGYSESSQVRMHTAYQNRVAVARESFNRAIADYNIAIEEAKNQNSSLMAEITYKALMQKLELSMKILTKKMNIMLKNAENNVIVWNDGASEDDDILSPEENTEPFGAGSSLFPFGWGQ